MVQDSGGVPLSVKGVVIGLHTKSMDVVWDVPFMSGVTMGDRYVFHDDLNTKISNDDPGARRIAGLLSSLILVST